MRKRCFAFAIALAASLAACGPGENDPGPGGVTVNEARALDDAAEMLEDRRLPAEALDISPATVKGENPPVVPEDERNEPDAR